ncbi:MsnO8 family LLM class oxidoreductase [Alkalihalobacillus pseudalcaliphilus]|uniref:MsnO8 family LLM class oxidoreductase n=1 Tax=Alkalihalobacillus pseudalcaliphilus TaxID=79884 RepID=UPI00064DCE15|nr:MsnO8 family LLM class oxidoreductase [Alkalihalobacillus pseudalcaliphilus]KMK76183.1 hypothetical protein AB990_13265 [Alkalihalobacillus pseudalcaliphilus]
MRLSILDQVPLSEGSSYQEAYEQAKDLAVLAEKLGYHRYWIAEHHHLSGLVCPSPEVLLTYIGTQTRRIRLGSGATLLPHYKPYKVAETFHMLATLFPGRIDLGVARSPGGSAEVTNALNDHFLQKVFKYAELIDELKSFIKNPKQNPKTLAIPIPETKPEIWILGSSHKSALLAIEKDLPYTYGHFQPINDAMEPLELYNEQTKSEDRRKKIVALPVICGETEEEAHELALSESYRHLLIETGSEEMPYIPSTKSVKQKVKERPELYEQLLSIRKRMLVGSPERIKTILLHISNQYDIDECMLLTNIHAFNKKKQSFELIMAAFDK